MNDKSENRSLRISPSVRITETQDGAVLLDVKQGICFTTNSIGVFIWKRLCEGSGVLQITQDLTTECCISEDVVMNDVLDFVRELEAKHLVVSRDLDVRPEGLIARLLRRLSIRNASASN